MRTIRTEKAPPVSGPYAQAVEANGFVFVSGQLGIDSASGKLVSEEISAQTEQAIINLKNILKAAGSSLHLAVKTTVYLTRVEDFTAMNDVYAKYFKNKPARTCCAVAGLPKGALVEIDCVALRGEK